MAFGSIVSSVFYVWYGMAWPPVNTAMSDERIDVFFFFAGIELIASLPPDITLLVVDGLQHVRTTNARHGPRSDTAAVVTNIPVLIQDVN